MDRAGFELGPYPTGAPDRDQDGRTGSREERGQLVRKPSRVPMLPVLPEGCWSSADINPTSTRKGEIGMEWNVSLARLAGSFHCSGCWINLEEKRKKREEEREKKKTITIQMRSSRLTTLVVQT